MTFILEPSVAPPTILSVGFLGSSPRKIYAVVVVVAVVTFYDVIFAIAYHRSMCEWLGQETYISCTLMLYSDQESWYDIFLM